MADYRRGRLRLSIAFGSSCACKKKTVAHVSLPLTSRVYQQYFIVNMTAVPVRAGAVRTGMPSPFLLPPSQELFIMPNSTETLHMPVKTVMLHVRLDQKMSDIVNLGVAVQAAFSTLCALEYLKSYNVAPELIERVLLHPEQRRQTVH
ncbi:hypothetical protein [Janthinobacterium sp. LB3P118]|uniref:hypothetical protein n=1 Tax=Janthinobacterium sp. LB3P118 TaxID=3424195 RepID=UPI003F250E91